MLKLMRFLPQWISKNNKINNERPSKNPRPFFKLSYIMDPITQFMHQLNIDAHKINKNIVGKSATLNPIAVDKSIYQPTQKQEVQPKPKETWFPSESYGLNHTQPAQQPVVQSPELVPSNLNNEQIAEFIDKMSSMEKKIDRFFNLIEKRVVKNAKEINIRIKLNESNEDTNSEQE